MTSCRRVAVQRVTPPVKKRAYLRSSWSAYICCTSLISASNEGDGLFIRFYLSGSTLHHNFPGISTPNTNYLLLRLWGRGGFETAARRATASATMRATSIMLSGTNGAFSLRHLFIPKFIAALFDSSGIYFRSFNLSVLSVFWYNNVFQ